MCVAHVRTVPHHQNAEKKTLEISMLFEAIFRSLFNGKKNGFTKNLECFRRNFIAAKLGQIAPPGCFQSLSRVFPKSFRKTEIVPPGEIQVLSGAISVLGLS